MDREAVNYYPAPGLAPFLARALEGSADITLLPTARLILRETYLYMRLTTREPAPTSIFNNHILRTKANYQFTREFSRRAIIDYNAVLPSSSLVSLDWKKRLGFDFLFTYMLHPGTALYMG